VSAQNDRSAIEIRLHTMRRTFDAMHVAAILANLRARQRIAIQYGEPRATIDAISQQIRALERTRYGSDDVLISETSTRR
jgi:hypothetical protein